MSVEHLAAAVVKTCEAVGAEYMIAGAFAFGIYGIPRSTKDVNIVLSVADDSIIERVINHLKDKVVFGEQVQFDTLTWGKRHVGRMIGQPQLQVELFELFDDPFVLEQFARKIKFRSPQLEMEIWAPTAEDVLVQKLRWARAKDLDDARDILAIQGTENLDMNYVRHWCREHGTEGRLEETLERVPEM